MGMYDYVSVPPELNECPSCGCLLNGWQSKDGDCTLSTISYATVNCFYTSCDACSAWVEYKRREPVPGIDYLKEHFYRTGVE